MITKMETRWRWWCKLVLASYFMVRMPDVSAVLPGVSRELCRAQHCFIFDILPKILSIPFYYAMLTCSIKANVSRSFPPFKRLTLAVHEQQIFISFIIDPAWCGNHASGLPGITLRLGNRVVLAAVAVGSGRDNKDTANTQPTDTHILDSGKPKRITL